MVKIKIAEEFAKNYSNVMQVFLQTLKLGFFAYLQKEEYGGGTTMKKSYPLFDNPDIL